LRKSCFDQGASPFAFDEETLEQLPERNREIVIRLLEEYADPEEVAAVGGPWWTDYLPKKPKPRARRKKSPPTE
jgi:hypothetical protein